jgi:hypothetical protein
MEPSERPRRLLGDSLDVFVRLEDAERFVEEARFQTGSARPVRDRSR